MKYIECFSSSAEITTLNYLERSSPRNIAHSIEIDEDVRGYISRRNLSKKYVDPDKVFDIACQEGLVTTALFIIWWKYDNSSPHSDKNARSNKTKAKQMCERGIRLATVKRRFDIILAIRGVAINYQFIIDYTPGLIIACKLRDVELIGYFITKMGANPSTDGVLSTACRSVKDPPYEYLSPISDPIVDLILDKSKVPNLKDGLIGACDSGCLSMTLYMLQIARETYGADKYYQKLPMHKAFRLACKSGTRQCVEVIHCAAFFENDQLDFQKGLNMACAHKNISVVKYLINHGFAKVTPAILHTACKAEDIDILHTLTKSISFDDIPIDIINKCLNIAFSQDDRRFEKYLQLSMSKLDPMEC